MYSMFFFFFKQKTAYEMRISDWSSYVCSSDLIMAPATSEAKNVMPRVAALLDVMVISDVSGIIDTDTFERPIYAGNAIQTVRSKDAKKIVTQIGRAACRERVCQYVSI